METQEFKKDINNLEEIISHQQINNLVKEFQSQSQGEEQQIKLNPINDDIQREKPIQDEIINQPNFKNNPETQVLVDVKKQENNLTIIDNLNSGQKVNEDVIPSNKVENNYQLSVQVMPEDKQQNKQDQNISQEDGLENNNKDSTPLSIIQTSNISPIKNFENQIVSPEKITAGSASKTASKSEKGLIENIEIKCDIQQEKDEIMQIDDQKYQDEPIQQVPLSQLLWKSGSQPEPQYQDNLTAEEKIFRQKCRQIIGLDQLFTVNINTYKASRLNNLLSSIGLRLENKESVLNQVKKREQEQAAKAKQEKILQQKREREMKKEQKRKMQIFEKQQRQNERVIARTTQRQTGTGHPTQIISSAVTSEYNYQRDGNEDGDSSYSHDNSVQETEKSNKNDDETDPKISNIGYSLKDHMPPNVILGVDRPMDGIEPRALSPTPRKSERERKNISYDKMNKGAQDESDDDSQFGKIGGNSSLQHNRDQKSRRIVKDESSSILGANQAIGKKISVEETNKKIADLFKRMMAHSHASIMNQPLDKSNPCYEQYKNDYKFLAQIEIKFRLSEYTNTKEIYNDMNRMFLSKFEMASVAGGDDFFKVQEFQNFFDQEFAALNNLPLIKREEINKNIKTDKSRPSRSIAQQNIQVQSSALDSKNKSNTSKPKVSANQGTKNGIELDTGANGLLNDFSVGDSGEVFAGTMVLPTGPTVKPLSAEEFQQLRDDIANKLNDEQRAGIEDIIPDCISKNEMGQKNIELSMLKQFPEKARKLKDYVKQQIKKLERQKKDKARREERKLRKMEEEQKQLQQNSKPVKVEPKPMAKPAPKPIPAQQKNTQLIVKPVAQNQDAGQPTIQQAPQNSSATLQQLQFQKIISQLNPQLLQSLMAQNAQQGSQVNPAQLLANPQLQQVLQAFAQQQQAALQRPGTANQNVTGAQMRASMNKTDEDDESSSSSSDED